MDYRYIRRMLDFIEQYPQKEDFALFELFKDEQKFIEWKEKLDFSDKIKYGIEIEVANLPYEELKSILLSRSINAIFRILKIPDNIANSIIQNFNQKSENAWIFSKESVNETEASSPILYNNLFDLNQVVAICTLFKAFGAQLTPTTGLHVNIGVDCLGCDEKAIENILKIWEEGEEIFYKIANPKGERLRMFAYTMAGPIKQNIQEFNNGDGSVTLETEEDMEKFLYSIQARNKVKEFGAWYNLLSEEKFKKEVQFMQTDEEKFEVYHKYNELRKKNQVEEDATRWTSINFNHMKWNEENPGRIELRLFNSSIEPETIFNNLLLSMKLVTVSLENAQNPDYKKEEFERICDHNVTESEKVNNILNLLFDEPKQRAIFRNRWESVKDEREYLRYKSGKDTFIRE